MSYLFILICIVLLSVFIKRPVDVFSMAYVSCLIYFFPAAFPVYDASISEYLIYIAALCSVAASAYLYDGLFSSENDRVPDRRYIRSYLRSAASIVIPLLFFNLLAAPFQVTNKFGGEGGLAHYALAAFTGFLLLCSVHLRSKAWIAICALVYTWMVLRGDRTQVVIAAIAASLFFSSFTDFSLVKYLRSRRLIWYILVSVVGLVGLVGKSLYGAFFDYNGGQEFAKSLVARVGDQINNPAKSFEPYHVQSILHFAVSGNDRLDSSYLESLPLQFMPFSGALGGDVHASSNTIKALYFSDWSEQSGVSGNFFAEGYMLFGMTGAIAFVLFYVLALFPLARALRDRRAIVRLMGAFAGAFWVFYIHRSSLFQIISHEKRIIISAIVLVVVGSLINHIRSVAKYSS